jgi:dynein heavy chain
MAADSKTLKEIENKILSLLASATTIEILDADTLIDILKASKITTNEINGRMADAKVLEVTINDTRNMYSSVAVRGSILYFVIADLGGIDPMY